MANRAKTSEGDLRRDPHPGSRPHSRPHKLLFSSFSKYAGNWLVMDQPPSMIQHFSRNLRRPVIRQKQGRIGNIFDLSHSLRRRDTGPTVSILSIFRGAFIQSGSGRENVHRDAMGPEFRPRARRPIGGCQPSSCHRSWCWRVPEIHRRMTSKQFAP